MVPIGTIGGRGCGFFNPAIQSEENHQNDAIDVTLVIL